MRLGSSTELQRIICRPSRIAPHVTRRFELSLPKLAILGAGLLPFLAAPHGAHAQGRLEAQYEASLAGIVVGKGAWTIEISEDQ